MTNDPIDSKIIVQIKHQYGTERIYPINQTAKTFAELSRKDTLSRDDITKIKSLGYDVEVHQETVKL